MSSHPIPIDTSHHLRDQRDLEAERLAQRLEDEAERAYERDVERMLADWHEGLR